MRLSLSLFLLIFIAACSSPEKPTESEVEEKMPPAKTASVLVDDQQYPTLQWGGGLTWLGRNLSVDVEDSWCYGNSDACPELGRLYRWEGAQAACSKLGEGWRVPTAEEWSDLARQFGGFQDWFSSDPEGDAVAGNKALLQGGASGLDFVLNGRRGSNGGFEGKDQYGFYWTGTEVDEVSAVSFHVKRAGGKLYRRNAIKRMGFLCRCVK
ncbi:MAG: hypothetical protein GYB31_16545 [Bacteroidetes bacterium]|nr:hypothetical protein [Bacteroidota bacterium]